MDDMDNIKKKVLEALEMCNGIVTAACLSRVRENIKRVKIRQFMKYRLLIQQLYFTSKQRLKKEGI
jgi:hypothetical protein